MLRGLVNHEFSNENERGSNFAIVIFDFTLQVSFPSRGRIPLVPCHWRLCHDQPRGVVQVVHMRFRLRGRRLMTMYSAAERPFTFIPSTSFFVSCDDKDGTDRLFRNR